MLVASLPPAVSSYLRRSEREWWSALDRADHGRSGVVCGLWCGLTRVLKCRSVAHIYIRVLLAYADGVARAEERPAIPLIQGGAKRRVYPRPPIVEGLCAVQWATPLELGVVGPGVAFEQLRDIYDQQPEVQQVFPMPGPLPGMPGTPVPDASGQITTTISFPLPQRVVFAKEGRTRLFVLGPNEVSAHSLTPYEGWESLRGRFTEALEKLAPRMDLPLVAGASLRYINRITLPAVNGEVEPGDWLTIMPLIPAAFPTDYRRFFNQTEHLLDGGRISTTLTYANEPPAPGIEGMNVVLDLDLRTVFSEAVSWGDAVQPLEELKLIEGAAFESLLQDSVRDLFK